MNEVLIFHLIIGNAVCTLTSKDPIKVLSVRGTSFEAAPLEGGSAAPENIPADGCATDLTVFLKQDLTKSDRPELASAKVVVSGGKFEKYFILKHILNHLYCVFSR